MGWGGVGVGRCGREKLVDGVGGGGGRGAAAVGVVGVTATTMRLSGFVSLRRAEHLWSVT